MTFVGIIESNREIVEAATEFFLRRENFSLLFVCADLEEHRLLPDSKKQNASLIVYGSTPGDVEGFPGISYLKQVSPRARILLVSAESKDNILPPFESAGADFILVRQRFINELMVLMDSGILAPVNGHEKILNGNGIGKAIRNSGKLPLSGRELEIVEWVVKGYTNKQIGERLYISQYTVNAHLRKIYLKLSVKSRMGLVNRFMNEQAS